jgi:hypothetical protein
MVVLVKGGTMIFDNLHVGVSGPVVDDNGQGTSPLLKESLTPTNTGNNV